MLRRVVLKLVRTGERRPIARTAAFVWVGLESGGGFSGRPPRNLVPAACAHLAIDERRVALRSDQPYASARLAVDDPEIAGRRHVFEFAYPGLIASLRWFDGEGRQHEEVLERDAIVTLKPGDTRLLDVTSPDQRAVLQAVAQAPVEEAPAVGLGREHRLAGRAVAGAALVVEDTVAHLMAFPLEA